MTDDLRIILPPELQDLMASLMPRQARYRYYRGPRGEMYCWSTERIRGKYVCWTYQPYGKGSRSGDPTKWRQRDRVTFSRRKKAKARAYQRYQKAIERR